ncbi:MAG: hypothetical protein WDW36_006556 [Sanguina aurantia]
MGAAPLTWVQLSSPSDTPTAPSARTDAGLAHDATHNRLILFGGHANGAVLDDTWAFSLTTRSWTQLLPSISPPGRHTFSWATHIPPNMVTPSTAASSPAASTSAGGMVISSGEGAGMAILSDSWYFSFDDDSWTLLPTPGDSPSARYGSGSGILPGTSIFYLSHGFDKVKRWSDTWAYDLSVQRWHKIHGFVNSYDPNGPHPRCLVASTVAGTGELVIYGGCMQGGETGSNGDGSSWTQVDTCPTGRVFGQMAVLPPDDPSSSRSLVLLYGGGQVTPQTISTSLTADNELDILDASTGHWTRINAEGSPPAYRVGPSLVADLSGATTHIYMFGGGLTNDVWMITGGSAAMTPPGQGNTVLSGCAHAFSYPHLHGLFMAVAFGICLQAGWMVARYCRTADPFWFRFHVSVQTFGLLLAMVAFIVVYVGGAGDPAYFAHGVIGIITFTLTLLQPLNAFLRPAHGAYWRTPWEWFHKSSGRVAVLLGLVNVSLGVLLVVPPTGVWIAWFAWLGVLVAIIAILELRHQLFPVAPTPTGKAAQLANINVGPCTPAPAWARGRETCMKCL